mmetsp:Transcript_52123/g.58229  ORF Transcript_52123/g.58229 Transcript_52123/m.58229 type:complete len:226 (-) Transcript_52123:244-921(-)
MIPSKLWLVHQSYVFLSIDVSAVKNFTKSHVMIVKTMNSGTSSFLTILLKLFNWSLVIYVLIGVLLTVSLIIVLIVHLISLTIVPSQMDRARTLHVVLMVPALLLQVLFQTIKILFLIINAVKLHPGRAFTPDCLCCLAMNLKPNEFYQKAFVGVRCLVSGLKKKSTISDTSTASQATHELGMNRLEAIHASSDDHLEDANIESDDESSVASPPDFHHGDNPFHK